MALAEIARAEPKGRKLHSVRPGGYSAPRLAPPLPRRSLITDFRKASKLAGVKLMPWQEIAGRYLTATEDKHWLYPEVAIVVGRQNGKSMILEVRIVMGLLRGERIMHTAQDRMIPRLIYDEVATICEKHFGPLLRGRPRFANGTEEIRMLNGGSYRIVAPSRHGARGPSNDLVVIDEARQLVDFDFVAAAEPTLAASKNPQIIYTSSAGWDESVVLNSIRRRAETDRHLAYLEWSAAPGRPIEDTEGWREANPRLGTPQDTRLWEFLQRQYEKYTKDGTPNIYENEHLCRWTASVMERLVGDVAWQRARKPIGTPIRPHMAVAVDPESRRVSAVLAWMDDGLIHVHNAADFPGSPIDVDKVALEDLAPIIRKYGIRNIGFDPWSDRDLVRHFKEPKPINGAEFEAASERFKRAVEGGQLRHDDSAELTADIGYTVRRETGHGWLAVRASADRPTTASLAAIRAVWLASKPAPPVPRVR